LREGIKGEGSARASAQKSGLQSENRTIPFDFSADCSYYVLIASNPAGSGPMEPKAPRSIFDIVYPTTPNGSPPPQIALAVRNRPVNFLYMGLFLGIEKHRSQFLTHA
jgi:hypothetical protein